MRILILLLLTFSSLKINAQEVTPNLKIPINDNDLNGVFVTEMKFKKFGRKTFVFAFYNTEINLKYNWVLALAKLDTFDKKGNLEGSYIIDGSIRVYNNLLTFKVNYAQPSGNNFLKINDKTKFEFINKSLVQGKLFSQSKLQDYSFSKTLRKNEIYNLIESFYTQKVKDRLNSGILSISSLGINPRKYEIYSYNIKHLNIDAKVDKINKLYKSEVLKANLTLKGSPRNINSSYSKIFSNELPELINAAMSYKGSQIANNIPNLDKIELYIEDVHSFNVFITRKNAKVHFKTLVTKNLSDDLDKIESSERDKEKFHEAKLKAEKIKIAKEKKERFENQFISVRSGLSEEEQISFSDHMRSGGNAEFFQYVYYGMFNSAKQYYPANSDLFSAIYANFSILLSKKYSNFYSTNSEYEKIYITNNTQSREIWTKPKFASSLKRNTMNSVIKTTGDLENLYLLRQLQSLNSEMEKFIRHFDPDSSVMIRLTENLYRYSEGLNPYN